MYPFTYANHIICRIGSALYVHIAATDEIRLTFVARRYKTIVLCTIVVCEASTTQPCRLLRACTRRCVGCQLARFSTTACVSHAAWRGPRRRRRLPCCRRTAASCRVASRSDARCTWRSPRCASPRPRTAASETTPRAAVWRRRRPPCPAGAGRPRWWRTRRRRAPPPRWSRTPCRASRSRSSSCCSTSDRQMWYGGHIPCRCSSTPEVSRQTDTSVIPDCAPGIENQARLSCRCTYLKEWVQSERRHSSYTDNTTTHVLVDVNRCTETLVEKLHRQHSGLNSSISHW